MHELFSRGCCSLPYLPESIAHGPSLGCHVFSTPLDKQSSRKSDGKAFSVVDVFDILDGVMGSFHPSDVWKVSSKKGEGDKDFTYKSQMWETHIYD